MKKSNVLGAAFLLAAMTLVSCTQTGTSGESSESSSEETSSSEVVSPRRLEVALEHSSIPAGTTFYDGCIPTITYIDETAGETTDVSNYFNQLRFQISPIVNGEADTTTVYDASTALPAGEYQAKITARSRTATIKFTVTDETVETASEGNGYKTIYGTNEDFTRLALSNGDVTLGTLGEGNFPSKGTVNVLVIPVIFSEMVGTPSAFSQAELDLLERAYNGTDANGPDETKTAWESLHSYYQKSSYGKLDVEATIAPVYVYGTKSTDLNANDGSNAHKIVQAALDDYEKSHPDMSKFDANKDGYIDSVNVIYKTQAPIDSSNPSDLWWNFTSNASNQPNVSHPTLHRFFWSAYSMMETGYYPDVPAEANVDPHVLVHEHGHAMGLSDYYSYDQDSTSGQKSEAPAGCADMMDMNVGDHNAYSKMRFNWLRDNAEDDGLNVMYVDGSSDNFTVTINSFADEGDVLVVRNTTTDPWNETPYDEYLIVTYYTPTGVNALDSLGYGEWTQYNESTGTSGAGNGGPYRHPGVQIFHVDARVGAEVGKLTAGGKVDESTLKWEYTDNIYTTDHYDTETGTYESAAKFLTDNTPSRSNKIVDGKLVGGGDAEIEAVLSSGDDGFRSTSYANLMGIQSNLFGTKEYADANNFEDKEMYGGNTYSNYLGWRYFENQLVWNDGSTFNWTFSVESQTDTTATLHFVNNAAIEG